jgi:hypothetical protein
MGKGTKSDALANSGTANTLSAQNNTAAQNIYGSLVPQLQQEAAHPAGYTPYQKAAMNTDGQQSAGGSNAGAVGQGALLAARTRNAGTADAAIGQAARSASQNLGRQAVGTEVSNANLQNGQQQAGLRGLEGIGSTDLGASLNALGLSNQALNTANNAKPSFWQQMATGAGNAAIGAAFAPGGG